MFHYRNGTYEQSVGPYGYLLLGLTYRLNEERRILKLENAILVMIDLKLRCVEEIALYEDMFERPFVEIYEINGGHFYQGLPILNFDSLNIPEALTGVSEAEEMYQGKRLKSFINQGGPLKYSVNPICTSLSVFDDTYKELYACVLAFNPETKTGRAVGFDPLWKLTAYDYDLPVEDFYKLIDNLPARKFVPGSDIYERGAEYGFLNFSYDSEKQVYSYCSIWDDEITAVLFRTRYLR